MAFNTAQDLLQIPEFFDEVIYVIGNNLLRIRCKLNVCEKIPRFQFFHLSFNYS